MGAALACDDDSVAFAANDNDARGNLLSDGSRSFTYDLENRLLTASGSVSGTLAYDPLGRLRSYTTGGTTTEFLYDGDRLVAEYVGGAIARRYAHGPGVDEPLIWLEVGQPRRWLIADRQGSIIAATVGSGAATTYGYDPYGVPREWTGPRFMYTGQAALHELQLYHYKARVYDPNLGRFLQTDPVGYEDDLNLYAYVRNDPLNNTDPTGRQTAIQRMMEFFRPAEQARQDAGAAVNDAAASAAQAVRDDPGIIIDAIAIGVDIATGPSGEGPAIAAGRRALTEAAEAAVRAACCFVAGTLVDTEDGLRSIEDVEVGDRVLSRHEVTGETAYKPVTALIPGHSRMLWRVMFSVQGTIATLGTTEDHPWRTVDGRWLRTDELRPGEQIARAAGDAATVVSVENTGENVITYNFEVADFHTYFVGEARIWVHNCPPVGRSAEAAERAARNVERGIPESQLGPSGHPRQHTVRHSSRHDAREAAERETPRGGRTRHDPSPSNPNQGPHFQAEDAEGVNVHPTVHHEYPD